MLKILKMIFSLKGKIGRIDFLVGNMAALLFSGLMAGMFFMLPSLVPVTSATNEASFANVAQGLTQTMSSSSMLFTSSCYTLATVLMIALLIFFYFSQGIKRIRDIGVSVWFSLVLAIPYVGIIAYLFLFFYPGRKAS